MRLSSPSKEERGQLGAVSEASSPSRRKRGGRDEQKMSTTRNTPVCLPRARIIPASMACPSITQNEGGGGEAAGERDLGRDGDGLDGDAERRRSWEV